MRDEEQKKADDRELEVLLCALDKVAQGRAGWKAPTSEEAEEAKAKIKEQLKQFVAARNGSFPSYRGSLKALFTRRVDQATGSTGEANVESGAGSEGRRSD